MRGIVTAPQFNPDYFEVGKAFRVHRTSHEPVNAIVSSCIPSLLRVVTVYAGSGNTLVLSFDVPCIQDGSVILVPLEESETEEELEEE